ncbi:hypothetical protein [Sedimenticola sp.]|uniref:hypothetical protein n=1 Tax=Sedimenticola sp. TaxID=1940285 RepID=UPI003D12C29E
MKIKDKDHHAVTAVAIEFTEHQPRSYIVRNWLRVNGVSSTTEGSHFFSVSDPLSYGIKKNKLTIGRNEVCDAYLWLYGSLDNDIIHGEYLNFGWDSKPLDFFVLSNKSKPNDANLAVNRILNVRRIQLMSMKYHEKF